MADFEILISANTQAATLISGQESQFDELAADLVLRNLAVAADRLTPREFSHLSQQSVDLVLDVTNIANRLAPLDPADTRRGRHENDEDYQYRTSVWQPLHSLQRLAHLSGVGTYETPDLVKMKEAVLLAGQAFAEVVSETQDYPEIRNTGTYFWGNATAAAKRAKRAQEL